MMTFLIILSCLLWLASLAALRGRQMLAPALSYLALVVLSFARSGDYPLLPINMTMLTWWFCITLAVMFTVMLQSVEIRTQTRGTGYITGGAVAGMAIGLLGYTFTKDVSLLYTIMALATIAGTFLGFLLYTKTPDGRPVGISSGNFFRYLLAKGFPTAVTVMMMGVPVLLYIVLFRG